MVYDNGSKKDEVTSNNENEVLEFIEYLKSKIDHRPQCLMVSFMIKQKFPDGVSFYNNNHVITKIGDRYFDWDGEYKKIERFIPFSMYGDNWIVLHYDSITNTGHGREPIIMD